MSIKTEELKAELIQARQEQQDPRLKSLLRRALRAIEKRDKAIREARQTLGIAL